MPVVCQCVPSNTEIDDGILDNGGGTLLASCGRMSMTWVRGVGVVVVALAAQVACGGQAEIGGAPDSSTGAAGSGGTAGSGNASGDSGVDTGTSDARPAPSQDILFEVMYENYAWGANLSGVFITADGSIYSYDYYAFAPDASPPSVLYPATEQELRARYGTPKKTGSIPLSELYAHYAQVPGAAGGVLLRQFLCDDAGEITNIGYLYDEATALYSPVILGVEGDQAALNLAPQAASLLTWLSQYSSLGGSCTFISAECSGASCGMPAPSCPSHQRPSVVNGCWSDCVSSSSCLSVNDCSECGGGAVCATAQDGSKHCLQSICASTDACSCPFTPPCAGGSAFCTNTGPLQVRCGQ